MLVSTLLGSVPGNIYVIIGFYSEITHSGIMRGLPLGFCIVCWCCNIKNKNKSPGYVS